MAKRLVIGVVIVAVVVAGVLALRNRSHNEDGQIEETVRRARVELGEMVVSVTAAGSIVPKTEANLSAELPGKVAQVMVEVGDVVPEGVELVRLDGAALTLNVRQAEAMLAAAQAQLDQLIAGPRQEEVAVAKANLAAAEAGLAGARASLRELESGPQDSQIAAAEANLRAAEASLWLSNVQRDQIIDGASPAEIAAVEAQVASALVQQKIARDAHDQTLRCQTVTFPTGEEREICPALGTIEEQARYNLYAADEAVAAAQAQLNQLRAGATQTQVDSASANVAVAMAQRDAVQAQLDLLRAGPSVEQLQAAQANVAARTAQRDAAQAQLDLLLAGATVHQIATARANVEQAQVALEMAQAERDKTVLVAPFDGIVTAINARVGQSTPTTFPAVTVADDSELQIAVDVDEIDVARIVEGQSVRIKVDALLDEVVSGRVDRIAPAASQMGGVVVYRVTIVLHETDLPLRIGMSTTATIVIEQMKDVLMVPNWAIRIDRDTGKTYINLLQVDGVAEAEIEIGVRGEDVSQVLSGLEEGDVVVAGDVIGLRRLLEGQD